MSPGCEDCAGSHDPAGSFSTEAPVVPAHCACAVDSDHSDRPEPLLCLINLSRQSQIPSVPEEHVLVYTRHPRVSARAIPRFKPAAAELQFLSKIAS